MKNFGLGVLMLSAALVGPGCDDEPDVIPTDGGNTVSDGGTDVAPISDTGSVGDVNLGDAKAGDAGGDALIQRAKATLASVGGSTVTGTVIFTQQANSVTVALTVSGASPGKHGFHVHTNASCADTPAAGDAGLVPAGGAGGHFNPTSMMHGTVESDGGMHHAGDFGNVTVGADGNGSKTLTIKDWTVGDVVNRSLVIHADADDLMTQPTGASGARQACGIIMPF